MASESLRPVFLTFLAICIFISAFAVYSKISPRRVNSSFPIRYAVGDIDPRFPVSRREVIQLAQRAEAVWEDQLGRTLFEYDSEAPFKVNLVFDERQQRTLERKQLEQRINFRGMSYQSLRDRHATLNQQVNELKTLYESSLAEFTKSTADYEAQVAFWNSRGGAPEAQHSALQQTKSELQESHEALESLRHELNSSVAEVNELTSEINRLASENKLDVEYYNGQFVRGRGFEQGVFDGHKIDIFEFEDETDLEVTLMHEFGHALGLPHANSPQAIMYYQYGKQDLSNIRLTEDDIDLLNKTLQLK